jgi:predicted ABC-type ATPase
MSDVIPRLRMFAGPNGSGKTTVKNTLNKSDSWFGLYINPDDLERQIRLSRRFPLSWNGLTFTDELLIEFFMTSSFLRSVGLQPALDDFQQIGDEIEFRFADFTSYHASVLSDFLRRQALLAKSSFTFETVMSSQDKVDFLREAKQSGFKTYLYFVATEDPAINIQRVMQRVQSGGHHVPEDKILSRFVIIDLWN